MLVIRRDLVDAMVAHARRDHPDEACGQIAGPEGSDRPERIIEMENAERSPTFYRFDSGEQLKVWRAMDNADEVLGPTEPPTTAWEDVLDAERPRHPRVVGVRRAEERLDRGPDRARLGNPTTSADESARLYDKAQRAIGARDGELHGHCERLGIILPLPTATQLHQLYQAMTAGVLVRDHQQLIYAGLTGQYRAEEVITGIAISSTVPTVTATLRASTARRARAMPNAPR